MRIREATQADAAAVARVPVDSWRTTYLGIVPDEHLAGLSYEGRTRAWDWVLAANPSRRFYEALGGAIVRTKQIEIGGVMLDEVAYGWTDTRPLVRRLP